MAPLYSRYVPPRPSIVQDDAVTDIAVHETKEVEVAAESGDGRKKRKRNETDAKDRKAPKHAKSKDEKSEKDAEKEVKRSKKEKGSKAAKKDKKERKEVDVASPEVQDEDEEEDSKPSKHDTVFSKFQKAAERSAKIQELAEGREDEGHGDVEQPELHDIVPLPQKEREATPDYVPTFSALPHWLAHPITVSQSTTKPFSELALSSKTVAHLASKGWSEAFAVQAALLPLLLPHPYLTHLPPNDICVSAPTGSGKTLGYVLPIVESLRNRVEIKLRAVIVVPTRELVQQAQEVASSCASGTGLRVAVAVGNQNLAAEQESLIKRGRKYDPAGYKKLMDKAKRRIHHEQDSDDEEELGNTAATAAKNAILDDVVKILPDHVPTYTSAIDILICTPGRLVEHMNSTVGFSLDHVEWLIIDEADRLLDQSFQEWVAKVVGALERPANAEKATLDEAVDRTLGFPCSLRRDRYVRKVILSATMTRDIAKLSALRLRRPSLVQVKGGEEQQDVDMDGAQAVGNGGDVYDLPRTLKEFAVPVGDGLDKPLFLLQLLQTRILPKGSMEKEDDTDSSDDSSSSSDDDSDSDSDSDSSDSDSDSDSSSDSSSDSESASESDSDSSSSSSSSTTSSSSSTLSSSSPKKPSSTAKTTILIFTGSTEEASRLHHLLTHLSPSLTPCTTLLTRTTSSSHLSHQLSSSTPTSSSSKRGKAGTNIIITTDRTSRGLDLPSCTHVINYALPRSLQTYVHRVGRTARAGREGEAWTLFQETQGRWFWREVARSESVNRAGGGGKGVERVNLRLEGGFKAGGRERAKYESVLGGMREIVEKGREGKGKGGGKKGRDGDVEMNG